MSTTTANLGLVKPDYTDTADVQEINQNMDKVDGAVGATQNSFAILANGNTHAAVQVGQFVYVRGHSTLAEGLYTASANIPANSSLSLSNLTEVPGGGLNVLNNKIVNVDEDLKNLAGLQQLNGELSITINDVDKYTLVFVITLGCILYFKNNPNSVSEKTLIFGENNVSITKNGENSITLTSLTGVTNWMVLYTRHK